MNSEEPLVGSVIDESNPLFAKFKQALDDVKEQINYVATVIIQTDHGKECVAVRYHEELKQFNDNIQEYALYLRAHLEAATQIITNAVIQQRQEIH